MVALAKLAKVVEYGYVQGFEMTADSFARKVGPVGNKHLFDDLRQVDLVGDSAEAWKFAIILQQ